ncbi:hypothetical protein Agub_g9987, partial [Astrephomene gubernaculifera]
LLGELLEAEPACVAQLVAARGVPVLVHLITSSGQATAHPPRQAAVARAAAVRAELDAAPVTVNISVTGGMFGGRKGLGGPQKRDQAGLAGAAEQKQKGVMLMQPGGGSGGDVGGGSSAPVEEELLMQAVLLLRKLCGQHMAEVLAAGAVRALCGLAGTPGG